VNKEFFMDKWWQNLSQRDRVIVFYAGIVCAFMLFYLLVLSPLSEKNAALIESNAQTKELIGWMQNSKVQLTQLQHQEKNKASANVSLLSAIEQSVKRNRLESAAGEIKQQEKNHVQISFAQVDFLAVMRWIEDVQVTTASKIDKVTLQKTDKPGIVHVDLTLTR
jgi:type II secretory pathway component PulM